MFSWCWGTFFSHSFPFLFPRVDWRDIFSSLYCRHLWGCFISLPSGPRVAHVSGGSGVLSQGVGFLCFLCVWFLIGDLIH